MFGQGIQAYSSARYLALTGEHLIVAVLSYSHFLQVAFKETYGPSPGEFRRTNTHWAQENTETGCPEPWRLAELR